jgi:parallel beta-helix repeat protein
VRSSGRGRLEENDIDSNERFGVVISGGTCSITLARNRVHHSKRAGM